MTQNKRKRPSPFEARDNCVNRSNHTPHPKGQIAHAEWAERMSLTHTQERCLGCGYLEVWVRKDA